MNKKTSKLYRIFTEKEIVAGNNLHKKIIKSKNKIGVAVGTITLCSALFLSGCMSVPASPSIPTESQVEIVVKPGDTLSAIAIEYGTTIDEIMKLNDISDPNKIYIGQILKVATDKIKESTDNSFDMYEWDDKLENQGYVQGIDLSKYQKDMDLDKVLKLNNNIDFVFVRSFYFLGGREVDNAFDKFSQIAYKNGVALGTYFWPTLKDKNSTKEELDVVIAKLKENQEKGIYYTMPIVMDIETYDDGGYGLAERIRDNDQKTIECFEFAVNYLRDAGYEVMVYTGHNCAEKYGLKKLAQANNVELWIARYANDSIVNINNKDASSNAKQFSYINNIGRQYSQHGKINGYEGDIDLNVWYENTPREIAENGYNYIEEIIDRHI